MTDEKPSTTPDSTDEAATPAPEAATPKKSVPETTTPAPAAAKSASGPPPPFHWGLGRRKSSVARVRIRTGTGKFLINKRKIDDFFKIAADRNGILAPLKATESLKGVDVFVNVKGGGTTGQAGAIVLGLARALRNLDPECESSLRDRRFLTRDSREVERKKYGRRGARRRFQFSKR